MLNQADDTHAVNNNALEDFQEAHRRAILEDTVARLRGKPVDLLAYDEVRQKLRLIEESRRQLENIPLDSIVGSVNRPNDFTRSFLPRQAFDSRRWARVKQGIEKMSGLPPIEAYKVGDVYFVLDGHHRVSVAREMGASAIEGYVAHVTSHVSLSPGDSPEDLILKSEYDDFLAATELDALRPQANLLVNAPGQYPQLLEHIAVHRYFMGEKRRAEVPYPEALTDWYDSIYLPVIELIREHNLLRDFPGHTETDLYLWIMNHRAALTGGGLGWEVRADLAAQDLVSRFSPTAEHRFNRLAGKIGEWLTPEPFENGPPAGEWRARQQSPQRGDHLFDDILIALPGTADSWPAVQWTIEIAKREDARVVGLHILHAEAQREAPETQALQAEFLRRCAEAGVPARMVVEQGVAAELICHRAVWVDLVAFRLHYPPPVKRLQRIRSGTRRMIRRCSAPLLAIPNAAPHIESALLAYGPGRKAEEALFIAAYLAQHWNLSLSVVSAKPVSAEFESPLRRARQYLENHDVSAHYIEEDGDAARAILLNAEAENSSFIIMGAYEGSALRETLLGSTVDRVLRSAARPVLICK